MANNTNPVSRETQLAARISEELRSITLQMDLLGEEYGVEQLEGRPVPQAVEQVMRDLHTKRDLLESLL